jgi:hypothetical protein
VPGETHSPGFSGEVVSQWCRATLRRVPDDRTLRRIAIGLAVCVVVLVIFWVLAVWVFSEGA